MRVAKCTPIEPCFPQIFLRLFPHLRMTVCSTSGFVQHSIFIILETNNRDITKLFKNINACKDLIIILDQKVDIGSYAFEKIVLEKFDNILNLSYRGIRSWKAQELLFMLKPNL